LRLVAKYADACNLYAFNGVDAVRAKLEVLRRHCEEIGRPFDEIERTAVDVVDIGAGGMSPQEIIEHCRGISDAGIQHLIVSLP
jgi:16S rRNA G527 N7-methylase RsmG